jgi:predicted RNase H-like nuclease (RuvC/YqgF family)
MKISLSPRLLALTALVAASVLPGLVVAQEINSGNTSVNAAYNEALIKGKMRLDFLRQQLALETRNRIEGDAFVEGEINERMAEIEVRIAGLDTRITQISDDIDLTQSNLLAEIEQLKADVDTLRGEMEAQIEALKEEIRKLRQYMNDGVTDLRNQIAVMNQRLNSLTAAVKDLEDRTKALEDFARLLEQRLAALKKCFADSTCVGSTPPEIQTKDFDLFAGNSGTSQSTAKKNLGISSSVWQYCSLAGATNQSRRDFRIYVENGNWWLSNERDNHAIGDETGTLYARCMRVYEKAK